MKPNISKRSGDPDEQALAKIAIHKSMDITRYFKCALSTLVNEHADFTDVLDVPSLLNFPIPQVFRHSIRSGLRRGSVSKNDNMYDSHSDTY